MKEDRKVLDSMQEILERLVLETSALKAENARLVRKVEGMEPVLRKILGKASRSLTQANLSLRVMRDGALAETPLDSLNAAQRRQVDAVVAFHRAHPGTSLSHALERTFIATSNGYRFAGLKSFVFRHRNVLF